MTPHEKAIVKACSASDSVAPWVGDYAEGAISAYIAAMRVQGWVMAPVEPTEAMLLTQGKSRPDLAKTPATAAMAEALNREIRGHAAIVYREMIAAMLAAQEAKP